MLLEKLSLPAKCRGNVVRTVIVCALLTVVQVGASMTGGESGAYLRYPAGASALAMGGAYSAAPGVLLPFWNPAMLAHLKSRNVCFGGGIRSLGQSDAFAGLDFRVPPRAGMGFFLLYRGDPFLNDLYDINEKKIESAAYSTMTGKIALSYFINRKITAGANISIHYAKIPAGSYDGEVYYTDATSIGSFDFALSYKQSERLCLAAIVKDAGARLNWNFPAAAWDYNVPSDDVFLPSVILASSYSTSFLDKPLVWNSDLRIFAFDGSWKKLDRPQASFSNGAEWRYWQNIYVRMGIGELLFNGDITADTKRYLRECAPRITAGVSVDGSKIRKGLRVNYGCATDKIGAGIDQQLDIALTL